MARIIVLNYKDGTAKTEVVQYDTVEEAVEADGEDVVVSGYNEHLRRTEGVSAGQKSGKAVTAALRNELLAVGIPAAKVDEIVRNARKR